MNVTHQVRTEPDGNIAVGIETEILRSDTRERLATRTSDSNGVITYAPNGSPGPITLAINGRPGGDRSLVSGEVMTVGVFSPAELPAALTTLGDGVIRGYLDQMAVTVTGEQATVCSGAALVGGYPVVFYDASAPIPLPRAAASTRVDRIVVYIEPTTGLAGVDRLPGVEGAGVPAALTQTSSRYEIGLATISVGILPPVPQPVDERVYSGDRLDVTGSDRLSSASTTSVPGAAITDLAVSLTLSRAVTYDLEAEITGQQVGVTPTSTWALQNTYGPTIPGVGLSMTPAQVAVGPSGRIYIADTVRTRIMILNADGSYYNAIGLGLGATPTGVCVDSSENIYVLIDDSPALLKKYNASLVLQYSNSLGPNVVRHICTDNSHLYITINDGVIKVTVAGAYVTGWGTVGSGDSQFRAPHGIVHSGGELYVVDRSNGRVQVSTTSGTPQRRWSLPISIANGYGYGIGVLSTGQIAVTFQQHVQGGDAVYISSNTGTLATTIDLGSGTSADGVHGIGVASGDVLWLSNEIEGTIEKWDEATTPGGYGQIAIELDGVLSAYTGIGQRLGAVVNSTTGTKTGPSTVLVQGFAKSTLNTTSLSGLTLSARATPRG